MGMGSFHYGLGWRTSRPADALVGARRIGGKEEMSGHQSDNRYTLRRPSADLAAALISSYPAHLHRFDSSHSSII